MEDIIYVSRDNVITLQGHSTDYCSDHQAAVWSVVDVNDDDDDYYYC